MRMILSRLRTLRPSAAARGSYLVVLCCWGLNTLGEPAAAQPGLNVQQGANAQNALVAPVGNNNGGVFVGNGFGAGAQPGGAANADFDSLIDLIVSTVATETWAENGGGEAEVRPFPTGVLVDAAGTLRLKSQELVGTANDLSRVREAGPPRLPLRQQPLREADARQASALRYVSLPRLEREIARRQAARKPLDASMLTLAGLQRVRYVFVYPATGDIVLAGPAGDWRVDANGRILATATGYPVVRLDDLLTLVRRGPAAAESHFGCAINPRQEALARTQAFLASTSQKPLQPGQRKKWLGELRDTVGRQDISIWGIESTSRVASVLVEADYHMKLIGMGLADGVEGVKSYLASIEVPPGSAPPPMTVLRWWFALNYDGIRLSSSKDAFELVGQGVRVLSENELLADEGRRVHTNRSERLNRQFAQSFTDHFAALVEKYPVYGELRNIFDLAMVVALMQGEGLADQVGWKPGLLVDDERLRLPRLAVPRQVETVINHRVIHRQHIVAGVSGGVMIAPGDVSKTVPNRFGDVELERTRRTTPGDLAAEAWWWDAPAR